MQANSPNNAQHASPKDENLTPLMRQYWEIKNLHRERILLFRMGDFYEMFYDDAQIAAPVLNIALTSRNKKSEEQTPMCGVPHHSLANTVNKLLLANLKVAICDQVEDPKIAKGIVKRAVTRVLSPGVVFDPESLQNHTANYIASIDEKYFVCLDQTTGDAFKYKYKSFDVLNKIILKISPKELILRPEITKQFKYLPMSITEFSDGKNAEDLILNYLKFVNAELNCKLEFKERELVDFLELDAIAIQQLELFKSNKNTEPGSLFYAINRCCSPLGARLLRDWLQFPLKSLEQINFRQETIAFWKKNPEKLKNIRDVISNVGDIQRRLSKLSSAASGPRDMITFAESLESSIAVVEIASGESSTSELSLLLANIFATIVEDPPQYLRLGGVIQKGVSQSLDEWNAINSNAQEMLLELEAREREKTKIPSLKIKFNNIYGYAFEITKTHLDKVPLDRFIRKQTLAQAERFLTQELQDLESKILNADTKRLAIEEQIYRDLLNEVKAHTSDILQLSRKVAELDVVTSLAWLAIEQNYVLPILTPKQKIHLKKSRHPVIEQLSNKTFIANDIQLTKGHTLLLTGPNMAGKSTVMRQVAITAILAQIGSFVPAEAAELPIFDKIFSRIGASDALGEGHSTFMVEMLEVSEIIKNSTQDSLIILDEVGRGTSTYDGMSLAQAILEYLADKIQATLLFATHYHELSQSLSDRKNIHNAHMAIREKNDDVIFIYQLVFGAALKSFGIHVAKLAGIPEVVLKRSQSILQVLENKNLDRPEQLELSVTKEVENVEAPLSEIEKEISCLCIEQTTPLQALLILQEYKKRISVQ